MKEFWIQTQEIIVPILTILFALLFLSLVIYSTECRRMVSYKKQIDVNNNITNQDELFLFDPFLIFYLFTPIPSEKKYPKYYSNKTFRDQVIFLKGFRKVYLIASIMYLILVPLIIFF